VTLPYTAHLNNPISFPQHISEAPGKIPARNEKVRIPGTAAQLSKGQCFWWDTRLTAKWQKEFIIY